MSVAFRREGDEEHLEPDYELPIPPGRNLVTVAGRAQIAARVAALEAVPPVEGDDGEALKARKRMARDLRYWRQRLATAEVMPAPSGEAVEFGCRVRLLVDRKPREVVLVGHDEADPAQGKLAYTAPLARAIMGGEVGDTLDFGGRAGAITIEAIAPA